MAAREINSDVEMDKLNAQDPEAHGDERPVVPQRGAAPPEVHHASSQQQGVPDPEVDVPTAGAAGAPAEVDLAVFQSGPRLAEQQQVVDEHGVVVGDPQARQGGNARGRASVGPARTSARRPAPAGNPARAGGRRPGDR